ncbi:type IV pilin protein [Pseudoalteromonas sp.]|uniref:type IV pilin protein n=1 Tax=Pseudoalteromonas sp. TaxID=53249 RepID=UPI003562D97B
MKKLLGFTLIEMMIVVAIIGILTAIAYPSYVAYLYKGSRAEAMSSLLDIANRQEQFYADNHRYTSALGDLGVQSTSDTGLFSLTLTSDGSTFSVTASPIDYPATKDSECASFKIDELGQKTATGSGGNNTCWNR